MLHGMKTEKNLDQTYSKDGTWSSLMYSLKEQDSLGSGARIWAELETHIAGFLKAALVIIYS